jgi:hypothetical protein
MTKRPPPVPPESRSDKGPGEPRQARAEDRGKAGPPSRPDKTGQGGNAKVNTTNQGYQQDR